MNNREAAEFAFSSFQKFLKKNEIDTINGEIHSDVLVHHDAPNGNLRLSYALADHGFRLKAFCVVVMSDPYKGKPCFDVGISTFHKFRRQGHANSLLKKVIDELKNGLIRNGINEFYIDLKVDSDNEASKNLCKKFSDEEINKDNGVIFLKLIK